MNIFLDCETTGLHPFQGAEILELAIIDEDGKTLFNSLIKPNSLLFEPNSTWQDAEEIHGISPKMVMNSPTALSLKNIIGTILEKAESIIIYNARFDSAFILQEFGIDISEKTKCCMERFARVYGQYDDYHQSYTWKKLTTAAKYFRAPKIVIPNWLPTAHRALIDVYMCKHVWDFMEKFTTINELKLYLASDEWNKADGAT